MTTNRHERLERLFREVNELQPSLRPGFLERLPAETRAELESLLSFDQPDARIPLEGTPAQIAIILERISEELGRPWRDPPPRRVDR